MDTLMRIQGLEFVVGDPLVSVRSGDKKKSSPN